MRQAGVVTEPRRARGARLGALVRRLETAGADALETRELCEILVGSPRACPAESAVPAPPDPRLDELARVARRAPAHLRAEFGLTRRGAARLAAAFALGRRVERSAGVPRLPLRSAALVHDLMSSELRGQGRESFHVLLLDGKHRLRRRERVSLGTLTTSLVHPREVFGPAVREGAAAVIVVHNHPSGDPEPSPEDLAVTRRLAQVGALLGVPLLDHVVVADDRYVSIRERMPFDDGA